MLTPWLCQARSGSPFTGSSIFKISAPKSASCEETALPATSRDRSITRTPSSGQAAAGSNDRCGGLIGGGGCGVGERSLDAEAGEGNRNAVIEPLEPHSIGSNPPSQPLGRA